MTTRSASDLTLVIPTHNRSRLIRETLEKALNQTTPFSEIIVVDDGSTDTTPKILEEYGSKIRIIRQENSGVQVARNTGVDAASTKYITLCDDDDLLGPDYVTMMQKWLDTHPQVDVIYSNFYILHDDGKTSIKFDQAPHSYFSEATIVDGFIVSFPHLLRQTVRFQPLFPTGMTVRRDFYKNIGGFNPAYRRVKSEDWDFTLRAIASGVVNIYMPPINTVRKHGANSSGEPIKQGLGEATVLSNALLAIPAMQQYKEEVMVSISRRQLSSFNAAFSIGNLSKCREIMQQLTGGAYGLRFILKKYIVHIPLPFDKMAWSIVQLMTRIIRSIIRTHSHARSGNK